MRLFLVSSPVQILIFDLTSSNLHLQGFQLSKASAKGNIKSDPLAKGQFNIKAEQLHYGESVKLRLLDLALYWR